MVIVTLNGSPKVKDSNSEVNLSVIEERLSKENTIKRYSIYKSLLKEEISQVINSDILIFAFPLYVDGIPAHLLEQMILLEKAYEEKGHNDTTVYVIANNGFYEGDQNKYALSMVKNFCTRSNITWGQGIGIGAGEMHGGMIKGGTPLGKGPLKSLGKAMDLLVENIKNKASGEDIYVNPNFPSFAFKFMAHRTFWDANAKKNGITKKEMNVRLLYKN